MRDLPSEIHPDGLPHSYTIILMLRLLPDSPTEAFDVWQVSSKDHRPETGVTMDRMCRPIAALLMMMEMMEMMKKMD